MIRRVQPELLDRLAPDDPQAQGARRDLRRLNRWMGNARFLAASLVGGSPLPDGATVLDLGTGDSETTLCTLRRLPKRRGVQPLWLVDRHPTASRATLDEMRELGWQPRVVANDVFAVLSQDPVPGADVAMANLFLHHWEDSRLRELLGLIATRCRRLVACEPRRSLLARLGARLVGLIGCNDVTRHDAGVSVEAGFRAGELAALWPEGRGWRLTERPVGWCSHLFVAEFEEKAPCYNSTCSRPRNHVQAPSTPAPLPPSPAEAATAREGGRGWREATGEGGSQRSP